jgi:hypothetical protein
MEILEGQGMEADLSPRVPKNYLKPCFIPNPQLRLHLTTENFSMSTHFYGMQKLLVSFNAA